MKLSSFLKPGAILAMTGVMTLPALAQETAAPSAVPTHTVFILNTLLFVVAGFLVMWMAAGFAMLEAGLVRSKNVSMQLTKNIALFSIAAIMYYLIGFKLMYPGDAWSISGVIGAFGVTVLEPVEIGDEGYLRLAEAALAATDTVVGGVPAGLSVVAAPDSTLVALETDGSCDVFTVCDEMTARGWYVQPQMSYAGRAPTLHLSLSAATDATGFLSALSVAVAAAVAAGPVAVDPEVVAFIEALDPATLSDDDFDGLLAASGLVGSSDSGGLDLPDRMAGVNALLDVASPRMREALLVAFLDRLSRPTGRL